MRKYRKCCSEKDGEGDGKEKRWENKEKLKGLGRMLCGKCQEQIKQQRISASMETLQQIPLICLIICVNNCNKHYSNHMWHFFKSLRNLRVKKKWALLSQCSPKSNTPLSTPALQQNTFGNCGCLPRTHTTW